jgi:iron complex outermembrane receptor protein
VPIEIDLAPNPAFESEELLAYEAGYRRRFSSAVEMDLAVFFNDYDGIGTASRMPPGVVLDPVRLVQDVLLTNMTTAETYGFEGALNWRAADALLLSANYSFLDMELTGPGPEDAFGAEEAEGRSPHHQAGLRGLWDATSRLAVDGALYYVDELPAYAIDSHVRLDARLGWRMTDEIEIELVGQGLLDESRREFTAPGDANATQIGRSLFGRLTWRP